ncbi:succinate dehydrogenase/fumarate reductase flavoprotein subunit [Amycolatopsis lexingtonensis]|uniref:Succinate dehydrogenase/fumarate reductase flavoprotein subunit n=1 Tax=Amycolatopsis lexingtonensis TaxID=218822 RepID=A0ABR9HXX2_9PSEU|nr:hypothetical protein [Amycolatopsis lexingtonensis]MBE1495781.1 succinate dehydrogenase/fumarate reductase flavoprotein subunit [Amycolatopsis lexingtonensis]
MAANVRALRRAVRDTMTEHAGVVRDETGLAALENRMGAVVVQDLAHAFGLKAAVPAARAALERRGDTGYHNLVRAREPIS